MPSKLIFEKFRRALFPQIGGCVRLSRSLAQAMESSEQKHGRAVPSLAFGGDHTISIGTFLAARARDQTTR